VPGVRRDGALRRQQIVERYAEGTRIDVLGGALVLVGLVARAPPGDLTREGLVVKALLIYAPAFELGELASLANFTAILFSPSRTLTWPYADMARSGR
jgi:hypothetical protein